MTCFTSQPSLSVTKTYLAQLSLNLQTENAEQCKNGVACENLVSEDTTVKQIKFTLSL